MGGVCITETISKQPLIRSLGRVQAGAHLRPSRRRINSRFAVNWTNSRKGTHSRSEINGSLSNRLRDPIAKAGRPWRHGHCRRVPFVVAQSRIRIKEKSNRQPNTNRPNSFHILKSARASVAARALVHLSLRH